MLIHRLALCCTLSVIPFSMLPLACGSDTKNAADDVEDEVAGTIDCAQICTKYDDCVEHIDQTDCVDECENMATATKASEDAAKGCEDCIDGKACSAAESCWSDCPVVPVSD